MTPGQIQQVQHSFEQVAPIAEQAAALFYERLFTLDPGLRSLFKGDIAGQGRMLMQTLGLVVRSLDQPERIVPAVQALGARHAGYGVREADYDTVGAALLWTLEQGLGAAFTASVREAWAAAYGLLAGIMVQAGAAASVRAA
ncbi:hemin receptor [Solimonas fluminis]|uniref:Hemin receptor n=1 Tax=Solimonas fluminis TaxID=2086571 RepID=A0A2S5TD07_9GAMM|nr:globin family protein [Solimonas fluminis]PPE72855.1 hemin receptor [Solimonas fluminis]